MGCGAGAAKLSDPQQQEPKQSSSEVQGSASSQSAALPLPIIADNQSRLVIEEQLYKLNPVWADKLLSGSQELPLQAAQLVSWRRARWELWEEEDGLQLSLSSRAATDKRTIVSWSGQPPNKLKAEALPKIKVTGKQQVRKSKKVNRAEGDVSEQMEGEDFQVEVIDIPEEHKADPKELSPFLVNFEADGKAKCFVIGCEDELSCAKWVANLKLYSNIEQRFAGAIMWKLNATVHSALPDNWRDSILDNAELGDLQNWRRRLCYLEKLKSTSYLPAGIQGLCITYISEKADAEECVANILASVQNGKEAKATASIRLLPQITVGELTKSSEEHVKMSIQQYDIAVANTGHSEMKECILPTTLHAFEVHQMDDCGLKTSVFAFEERIMCEKFFAAVESSSSSLSKKGSLGIVGK